MPYIEMAVPVGISTSQLLVAVPAMPAEERPEIYLLDFNSKVLSFTTTISSTRLYMEIIRYYELFVPIFVNKAEFILPGTSPLRPKIKLSLC